MMWVKIALILLCQATAFQHFTMNSKRWSRSSLQLAMEAKEKKSMLQEVKYLSGLFGLMNVLAFAPPAFSGQPLEYVNPQDAVLNTEAATSSEVKAGREGVQALINKLDGIKSDLERNSQTEISDRVQKEFRLDVVRDTLNKDTQRGSDRLIRLFLQDVTSLEREGQVKAGRERSETRTNTILKTLNKAEATLKELQSFYPK